jgi:hypothetical protein
MKDGWIPPQGVSALPEEVRRKVPEKYQYWKEVSRSKRVSMRDEYVKSSDLKFNIKRKYDATHYLLEREQVHYLGTTSRELKEGDSVPWANFDSVMTVDMQKESFVLQHHWWKGQMVVRGGPSVEHWDMFVLPKGEMYVMTGDPTKEPTNASIRQPYAKEFWKKGTKGPEALRPGEPGNPTKNTPAWTEVVDSGNVTILEDGNLFKRFSISGKQLKGTYVMKREDANINLWRFEKAEMPGEKMTKLSAGHSMQQRCISLGIEKFGKYGDKFVVVGSALSYGVWNGDWYSTDLVDDRPERVLGIPVCVGPHTEKLNHGKVIDFTYDKETHTIKIASQIDDAQKQLEIEDGDYMGYSVEITVLSDDIRHIIEKIISYDRVNVVKNPACEVCTIDRIEGKGDN